MTKPLVTTITPDEGLASGRLRVTIRGQHFREITEDTPLETVRVEFNGVEADGVVVMARHQLEVSAPAYTGHPNTIPATVDITVTNLDNDGDPIAGETTTAADAFTYRRPRLALLAGDTPGPISTLEAVSVELIKTLRNNLLNEVAPSTDPDWSRDPSSGITAVSQIPAILLDGPTVEESTEYRWGGNQPDETEVSTGEYATTAPPFTGALTWSIVIVADRKAEAVNLVAAAVRYFHRRPFLRIPISVDSSDYVEVDIFVTESWRPEDRPGDRLYVYSSELRVEPVYLDDDYGLASGGVPVGDISTFEAEDLDVDVTGQ